MLWPLADRPRLAPGVPGGTIPVRLVDDDLATSLATGGRLDILLSAAEVATSHDVDPDGAVGRALCLAVDPDLLVTVNAMTGGYVVSNSPDGPAQQPGTPTHPGTGQAAATDWLNRLRALAHRTCVAPLPVCASRSGRPAAGQRSGTERDRHQQRRRHRRPHPGRPLHPRRHAAARRPVDQPRGQPAQRQRQHGRDRRRRLVRPGFHAATPPRQSSTPHPGGCPRRWWSRRSTRPSVPRWPGRGTAPRSPPIWTPR